MPRFNPSNYDSSKVNSFVVVKPGIYLVKVVDAEVATSKNGNEYWKVKYSIVEQGNEFFGKNLWDIITFSEKTMNRVKLIFEAFGVDMTAGEREYIMDEILGSYAKVQVTHIEDYTNSDGQVRQKPVIGFDGYFLPEVNETKQAQKSEEDIPF